MRTIDQEEEGNQEAAALERMGSSKLIEYFIALFVGLLAILGALLVIGFLLVDPLRDPNGIDDTGAFSK